MEHESPQTRIACFDIFQEKMTEVRGLSNMPRRECNTNQSITFNQDESHTRKHDETKSCPAISHSTDEFVDKDSFESRAWKRLTGMVDSVSDSVSETVETFYRRVDEEMKRSVVYSLCRELFVPSPALVPVVHQHSDVDLSHLSTVSSISNGSFEYERNTSTMRTNYSPHHTPTPSYLRSNGDDDERLQNSPLRSDYSITRRSDYSAMRIDINKTMISSTDVSPHLEPRHKIGLREFLDDIDGTKVILTPSPYRNKAQSESPFMAELFRSDVEPFE